MAPDTTMDVDMDMDLDFEADDDLARIQAEAARINAVRCISKRTSAHMC